MYQRLIPALIIMLTFSACKEEPILVPKPRSFPKVEYPGRDYVSYESTECDFTFEFPTYMKVVKDGVLLKEEENQHPCWFDLYAPKLGSRLHLSYVPVTAENPLDKLHNDAFKLAFQHNVKATNIEEQVFENQRGAKGYIFNLSGPVASSYMFYLTDGDDHYLRGSLYFDTKSRPDSIAPVLNFVKQDVDKILKTFTWTKS